MDSPASETSQGQIIALRNVVISMTVESWRLVKVLERLLNSVEVKEQQRYQGKIRWFVKKTDEALKSAGLNLVNYEGRPYDPGIPATPINLEDFQTDEKLYVMQMLEPVIVDSDGKIVKTGTVSLGKVE